MIVPSDLLVFVLFLVVGRSCHGLLVQRNPNHNPNHRNNNNNNNNNNEEEQQQQPHGPSSSSSRRVALERLVQSSSFGAIAFLTHSSSPPLPAWAADAASVRQERLVDSFDIDSYLKKGFVNNPMGVSGQAGKSRPETGVVLRDGSEASQDGNGNVLAEILVKNQNGQVMPILATFTSPWPLATGTVFDVECRDGKTGDGTFLAVTSRLSNSGGTGTGTGTAAIPDSFFVNQLFAKTGRFSFYGEPTDVKVKQAYTRPDDGYRVLDVSFSILSQATQAEIPHVAKIIATVPTGGADQAVMLVTSSLTSRWKKNKKTIDAVQAAADSFRAIPAPQSSFKLRGKPRRGNE